MNPRDVLRQFLFHGTLAFLVWLLVVFTLEFLIPGFVTPFVDIVDLAGMALLLIPIGLFTLKDDSSRGARIFSIICSVLLAGIGLAFLWFSLDGVGKLNVALWASIFILSLLTIYAVYSRDSNA